MCASYGLGGGPFPDDDRWRGIEPLDERVPAAAVLEWMDRQRHNAKITGRNARNLNPLIIDGPDGREVQMAWWWLHVRGAPAKYSAFNATVEKLGSSWRMGMARRALIPATWYIEKGRTFGLGGEPFGMAAITTPARQDDGSELLTYALVTRPAVAAAAEVHPRMPMILPREMHDDWLDPDRAGDADLVAAALGASEGISREVTIARATA